MRTRRPFATASRTSELGGRLGLSAEMAFAEAVAPLPKGGQQAAASTGRPGGWLQQRPAIEKAPPERGAKFFIGA
jgi:hypothetical protein